MPPKLRRNERTLPPSNPIHFTAPEQLNQLHSFQRNPHSSGPEDNQMLYHHPQYKYPHTLTFLEKFTPEAEALLIREFSLGRRSVEKTATLPATTFSTSIMGYVDGINGKEKRGVGNSGGWAEYFMDLISTGFHWVTQHLKLSPRRPKKSPKRRRDCVRNGGGPFSFLPSGIFDETSDTEPDDDDDDLTKKYPPNRGCSIMGDREVETVFGKGVVVERSFGGGLVARVVDEDKGQEHGGGRFRPRCRSPGSSRKRDVVRDGRQ